MPRHPKRSPMAVYLVYTMGRVGTSAVSRALRRAGLQVVHVHYLRQEAIGSLERRAEERGIELPSNMVRSDVLAEMSEAENTHVRLITLFRVPLLRNLSAFAFHYSRFYPQHHFESQTAERLLCQFQESYNSRIPDDWLLNEFQARLGINLQSEGFPREIGWMERNEAEHLILCSDLIDATKGSLLRRFTGQTIQIAKSNHAGEHLSTGAATLYQEFVQLACANKALVDDSINSAVGQLFWTEDRHRELLTF